MAKVLQRWIDKTGVKYVIDFFEGNNPPFIADIDTFHLYDAAGFPNSEDTDVVFKLQSDLLDLNKGFTVSFMYMVNQNQLGSNIRFLFDSVGHEILNGILNFALYPTITTDLNVTVNSNILKEEVIFTVPNGIIDTGISEIECRVTRNGSSPSDTFVGDFGLKQMVITQT